MSEITNPVKALFLRALEVPLAEREAFLAQQCGDDADRLAQVQELLAAHEQTGSFVVDRQAGFPEISASPRIELGEAIGPYKLLQEIGEGGMGIVYMADQKEPIKRRVALKIIKPGMDNKQVLAGAVGSVARNVRLQSMRVSVWACLWVEVRAQVQGLAAIYDARFHFDARLAGR